MKNKICKLLCVALCVAMMMSLIIVPAGAAVDVHDHVELAAAYSAKADLSKCNGKHTWGNAKWEVTDESSCFGVCEAYYETCSVCGARWYKTFRKYQDYECKPVTGNVTHSWTTNTYSTGCKDNPTTEKYCSLCGQTEVTAGGHEWVKNGDPQPGKLCTDYGTQEYKCADCGATKTESSGARGSHTFEEVKTEATCTAPSYTSKKCKICGYEIDRKPLGSPKGHQWVTQPNHTRKCSVCGETTTATEHTWSGWKSDESNHWKQCTECGTMTGTAAHTYKNGKCTVCGRADPVATCNHNWEITKRFGAMNHYEQCTLCGTTRQVSCAAAGKTMPRTYCTDPTYCECGNKIADGQKRHNFGTWNCTDSGHTHYCLNTGCQYNKESKEEPHTYQVTAGTYKCSVCSYVDASRSAPHTHTYGPWTAGNNGCVKFCTDPTCSALSSKAHKAGPADCAGNATCVDCGAAMKTTPGTKHGPFEVRNYKDPQVGVAGYTGDSYCLTCGKVITPGKTIPALEPAHTHVYNILKHNASGHWYECSCGEKQAVSKHSGGTATCSSLAKCSVCGESYGSADKTRHTATKIVRETAATETETGYTGDTVCTACGTTISKGKEIPKLPASHSHSFTILKHDTTGHWYECSCGAKKDTVAHSGGTATCVARATCSVCGEKYGPLDPDNHTGRTETVNKVDPQVGIPGYTGSTVCADCKKVLKEGEIIPALEPEHTHSFVKRYDAVHHWDQCGCGVKENITEHVYVNGQCACGAKAPEEEKHVHSFSAFYKTDSQNHWQECECGEKSPLQAHVFVDGKCQTCGMTYVGYIVTEKKEEAREELKDEESEKSVLNVFTDMAEIKEEDHYAVMPIQRLYNSGIMGGTGDGTFDLYGNLTELQTIIILARINGESEVSAVWEENAAHYMAWGVEHGIVNGAKDPDDAATRQEIVYKLWVLADKPNSAQDISSFNDAADVSARCEMAVRWAVEKGILRGDNNSILPNDLVFRKDAATLVTRYIDALTLKAAI